MIASSKGIPAFPKIFNLGTDYIRDIFKEPVEITEKVDGSQFAFGLHPTEGLIMRSKGRRIYPDQLNPKDMFTKAVDYVQTLDLPLGVFFYCEYLQKPKHNVLAYTRTPENHLCLFGMMDLSGRFESSLRARVEWAGELRIDPVPTLAVATLSSPEQVVEFLETESYLGGCKVEGVVLKNYARPFLLGGQPIPLMAGKYVSEAFKEVHRNSWKKENTGKGKWETFLEGYRTDARWQKSVQHLRDAGEISSTPKDIGKLIKEIKRDIAEEERETISKFLWREFAPQLLRRAAAGFPEWYKQQLLTQAFAPPEKD